MGYGQELPMNPDGRGIIPKQEATAIRKLRAQEQWERYDSVVIGDGPNGQGAQSLSRGWFNNWNGFASADQLQWFSGRDTGAGPAYTNQVTERTDWAQDIYHVSVEFISPPGISDIETDNNDGQITPLIFSQMLPSMLSLRVVLADSDEIAKAPANHYPAGYGVSYPLVSGAAAATTFAGNNGEPIVSNTWKFPEPVMLAAKAKITVVGQIDQPIRSALQGMVGPGSKLIPVLNQDPVDLFNWYVIKITLRGPRYLQLRGARSSA